MEIQMPKGKRYTMDEVTLCAYAALYDAHDFGGLDKIISLEKNPSQRRSIASVTMKIQNIASMLDEHRVERQSNVSPLTGLTTGKKGRKTDWNRVEICLSLRKEDFLRKCMQIIETSQNATHAR